MANTEQQQERISLVEAWRRFTGKEPPVLTEQQIAEFDAKLEALEEEHRRIYGDDDAE
jgi:hypothetical protein